MALTKVTRSGITDDSINADKIEDGTIVDADITPGTITNAKLAGSITNAKLANSSITINGSTVSLGGSVSAGSIDWQSVVTGDTTMVAGRGYFVNTTSGAVTMTLPSSASAGDTIAIKDYAGTFATNSLTIGRNSHKIQGVANDSEISTNRASIVLVYIDATKGWLYTNESNVADLQQALYVTATGGTVTTSGNFKIHKFTGDGCFVVSCAGNSVGNNKVDYMVVAGGGGGGFAATGCSSGSGGGGAGGFRESYTPAVSGPYTASPLKVACGALTVTAQTYPVTVGAGGGGPNSGPDNAPGQGNNSVFSTITSAGGGAGANNAPCVGGRDGGSGGGGSNAYPSNPNIQGGSGNTPPVSPPQGADGGNGVYNNGTGGGGGAGGCSGTGGSPSGNGDGGPGVTTAISGSPVAYAGGGGGGDSTAEDTGGGTGGSGGGGNGGTRCGSSLPVRQGCAGTANTGGGGGGGASGPQRDQTGGAGGKGIVIIRYKYQ